MPVSLQECWPLFVKTKRLPLTRVKGSIEVKKAVTHLHLPLYDVDALLGTLVPILHLLLLFREHLADLRRLQGKEGREYHAADDCPASRHCCYCIMKTTVRKP
jgi:hypothetical protein